MALDDFYVVDEDSVLNVGAAGLLGNDTDVDGDTLAAAVDAIAVARRVAKRISAREIQMRTVY